MEGAAAADTPSVPRWLLVGFGSFGVLARGRGQSSEQGRSGRSRHPERAALDASWLRVVRGASTRPRAEQRAGEERPQQTPRATRVYFDCGRSALSDCAAAGASPKGEGTPKETPPSHTAEDEREGRTSAQRQKAKRKEKGTPKPKTRPHRGASRSKAAERGKPPGRSPEGSEATEGEGTATKRSGSEATRKRPRAGGAAPPPKSEAEKERKKNPI